jgi:hypothetical protein
LRKRFSIRLLEHHQLHIVAILVKDVNVRGFEIVGLLAARDGTDEQDTVLKFVLLGLTVVAVAKGLQADSRT